MEHVRKIAISVFYADLLSMRGVYATYLAVVVAGAPRNFSYTAVGLGFHPTKIKAARFVLS